MSETIAIPVSWQQIILPNKKFVFMNLKEQAIALHPPFLLSNLQEFLEFYDIGYTIQQFVSQFEEFSIGKGMNIKTEHNDKNSKKDKDKDKKHKKNQSIDNGKVTGNDKEKKDNPLKVIEELNRDLRNRHLKKSKSRSRSRSKSRTKSRSRSNDNNNTGKSSRITDQKDLDLLLSMSKSKSVDLILHKAFMIKYGIPPNYQYSNKSKVESQTCLIKLKNIIYAQSDIQINRIKAKESTEIKALTILIPSIIDKVLQNTRKQSDTSTTSSNDQSPLNIYLFPNEAILKQKVSKSLTNSDISMDSNDFSEKTKDTINTFSIDDRCLIEKHLNNFEYEPLKMVNTIQKYYPQLDININILKEKKPIMGAVIESNLLKIKTEAFDENVTNALQYSSQMFLKELYIGKFTYWVDLYQYFIKDPKNALRHMNDL